MNFLRRLIDRRRARADMCELAVAVAKRVVAGEGKIPVAFARHILRLARRAGVA